MTAIRDMNSFRPAQDHFGWDEQALRYKITRDKKEAEICCPTLMDNQLRLEVIGNDPDFVANVSSQLETAVNAEFGISPMLFESQRDTDSKIWYDLKRMEGNHQANATRITQFVAETSRAIAQTATDIGARPTGPHMARY